jgi:hypothetical protein
VGAHAATVFDVSGSAQTERGVKRVRGWFGGAQFTVTLLQKCRDWRRRAKPVPIEPGGSDLRRRAPSRRTASQPRGQVRDHLVGVEGFEPPTSNSQSSRSTNLSYTPRRRILTRDFAPATALSVAPQFTRGYRNAVWQNALRDATRPLACYQAPRSSPLLKPQARSQTRNGW